MESMADIDRVVGIILSDEKLFRYVMRLVKSRLTPNMRNDPVWMKKIIDITIENALDEVRVIDIVQSTLHDRQLRMQQQQQRQPLRQQQQQREVDARPPVPPAPGSDSQVSRQSPNRQQASSQRKEQSPPRAQAQKALLTSFDLEPFSEQPSGVSDLGRDNAGGADVEEMKPNFSFSEPQQVSFVSPKRMLKQLNKNQPIDMDRPQRSAQNSAQAPAAGAGNSSALFISVEPKHDFSFGESDRQSPASHESEASTIPMVVEANGSAANSEASISTEGNVEEPRQDDREIEEEEEMLVLQKSAASRGLLEDVFHVRSSGESDRRDEQQEHEQSSVEEEIVMEEQRHHSPVREAPKITTPTPPAVDLQQLEYERQVEDEHNHHRQKFPKTVFPLAGHQHLSPNQHSPPSAGKRSPLHASGSPSSADSQLHAAVAAANRVPGKSPPDSKSGQSPRREAHEKRDENSDSGGESFEGYKPHFDEKLDESVRDWERRILKEMKKDGVTADSDGEGEELEENAEVDQTNGDPYSNASIEEYSEDFHEAAASPPKHRGSGGSEGARASANGGSSWNYLSDPDSPDGRANVPIYFDQAEFDAAADAAATGQAAKRVKFAKDAVKGIFYRDKTLNEEKLEFYYSHAQEEAFVADQMREFNEAQRLGMTWMQWVDEKMDDDYDELQVSETDYQDDHSYGSF